MADPVMIPICGVIWQPQWVNILRPRQMATILQKKNLKYIFLNQNIQMLTQI